MPTAREFLALPLNASFCVEAEEEEAMINHLSNDHFRWFVQWVWSSGAISIHSMTLLDERRAFQIKEGQARAYLQLTCTCTPSGCWSGQQRGAFPIYQQLMQHYQRFEQVGRPEKQDYHVHIAENQCRLSLRPSREPIILRENLFSSLEKLV